MDQATQFVQRVIDMLRSKDIQGFVDLFTPEAELILPKASCRGQDAIQRAITGMYQTYDEITIELKQVISQRNVIFVQWRWSDRKQATGQKNETDTALVLELEASRIKYWREYHTPITQNLST